MVQQQNAAVPRPRQRCDSVHPLHFRWECGCQQSTRLVWEIARCNSRWARNAGFPACGLRRLSSRLFQRTELESSVDSQTRMSALLRSGSPTAEARRRGRRQCRCDSCHEHRFKELKPQQTGTGLLIRYGEVATTSGSTTLAGSSNRRTAPFEGANAGAIPAPVASLRLTATSRQANFRPVVK